MSGRHGEPLVLHSSRLRLALQWLTPLFLLAFGAYGLTTRGSDVVPLVVLLLGAGLAAVVLLDLPLRSEFDEEGVTRVCALRHQRLPWSRVVAVERLGGVPERRRGDDDSPKEPGVTRGLAARTGPRRVHLLVDRRESHAEYGVLRDLLRDRATQLRASQPPIDAGPAGRGPRALHRRQQS